MAGQGRKWLAWAGYTLFGLAVFVAGMVVTFPVQVVADRLGAQVAERTGWQVAFRGGGWMPLTGVRFDEVTATPPAGRPIEVSDVRLKGAPTRLLEGVLFLHHDARVYGGRVVGQLEVEGRGPEAAYTWDGHVRDVDLSTLPFPPPGVRMAPWAKDMALAGDGAMDVRTGWRAHEPARGNGTMTVELDRLGVSVPNSPLGRLALPIGRATARLNWQRGNVDVEDLVITGDVLQGSGGGRVRLGATPQASHLDLRFTGAMGSAFPMREMVEGILNSQGSSVTISIRGSLASPILYVNGKPLHRLMTGG